MINEKIIKAIKKINPVAEVTVYNNNIDSLVWSNGTTPIAKADIEAKMTELQTEYAEAYCEKEIGGSNTKWDAYKTAYNKVRTDNPKE